MTEEQRDQARRERRHVVESNKDWKAATAVRRRWMAQQFAPRKTAPAGAESLVAAAVAGGWPHAVGAAELLGATKEDPAVEAAMAAPRRALQIAAALVVANWEASLVEDAWRATYRHRDAVQVFQAIAQWGHQLSDNYPTSSSASWTAPPRNHYRRPLRSDGCQMMRGLAVSASPLPAYLGGRTPLEEPFSVTRATARTPSRHVASADGLW